MLNKKISELPNGAPVQNTDEFVSQRSPSLNVKFTAQEMAAFFVDIKGPISSTLTAVPRWGDITGDTLDDSGVMIDGSDNVTIPENAKLTFANSLVSNVDVRNNGGVLEYRSDVSHSFKNLAGSLFVSIDSAKIAPGTDNTVDLGTGALRFKDLYLSGALNVASIRAGTDDTVQGSSYLYGGAANDGGFQRFYNGALDDATYEYYSFQANGSLFNVGPDTDSDMWQFNAANGNLALTVNGGQVTFVDSSPGTGFVDLGSGFLRLNGTQGVTFRFSNSPRMLMTSSTLRPQSAGLLTLGSATFPWGDIHCNNALYLGPANSGGTPSASADDLIINRNGSVGISMLASSSNSGNLYFGDSADGDRGKFGYTMSTHANPDQFFWATAGGANGMTFDSNNDLWVDHYVNVGDAALIDAGWNFDNNINVLSTGEARFVAQGANTGAPAAAAFVLIDSAGTVGSRVAYFEQGLVAGHASIGTAADNGTSPTAFFQFDLVNLETDVAKLLNFTYLSGTSTKNPAVDAPDSWLSVKYLGFDYRIPLYTPT